MLAIGVALIFVGEANTPARLGRGASAPDFTLERLDSESPIALEDYSDRVVLVNFWATWCKPCEDEMPSMERLYRRLEPEGFRLIAISVDEDSDVVRQFRDRLGISFPIALDPTQRVSRLYQTTGFPESLLVDRDGTVVERYVGPRDWAIYRERIQELLRGS